MQEFRELADRLDRENTLTRAEFLRFISMRRELSKEDREYLYSLGMEFLFGNIVSTIKSCN